jgi:hypothetical protein
MKPKRDHEPGSVGHSRRPVPAREPEEQGNEVESETEEITRYTYSAGHWYVRANDTQLAKYSALSAEERTQFLAKKIRVKPGYSHHTAESLAATLSHDLKASQRKLAGGELKGSRGPPLD